MSFWAPKNTDDSIKVFDNLRPELQDALLANVGAICLNLRGMYDAFTEAERASVGVELERVGMKLINKAVFAFTTGAEPADIGAKLKEAVKGSAFFARVFEVVKNGFSI